MKKILILTTLLSIGCSGPVQYVQGPTVVQENKTKPIKLCEGETSYPSSFPEYGLCIDNVLYGVFWMNGSAWLGEIAEGRYRSTSSSVKCNFTVKPNCVIERN